MIREISLDLETMSTDNDAAIIQIGACYFNRGTGEVKKNKLGEDVGFNMNIDLQSCIDAGLSITGSTVYWWLNQSDDARKSVSNKCVNFDTSSFLTPVLVKFESWIREYGVPDCIWSHATFDFVILKNAFKAAGMNNFPFNYHNARDLRTLFELTGFQNVKREGTHHDAYDDAVFQAKCVAAALQNIEIKNKKEK